MRTSILRTATALTVASLLQSAAFAADWTESNPGTYGWSDEFGWNPAPPNGVGETANFTANLTGDQTVTVPGSTVTVGIINIGDGGAAPDSKYTIGSPGAGTIILDNGPNNAQINSTKELAGGNINADDVIGANVKLNSNLVITVPNVAGSDFVRINGNIHDGDNGPRGLIKEGAGNVELGQSGIGNTYTGLTVVNGGHLRLASGGGFVLVVGDVEVYNGATIRDSNGNGNPIGDNSNINLVNGFYNPSSGSDTIGSLEGAGTGSQAGGGAGTVTFGGNNLDKTFNGTFQSSTSWTKVGTGTQTLGGTDQSAQSSGSRNFRIHGGKVLLNKTAGVTSIAQSNLFVGDGSQSGAARPELRLLTSNQIQVHTYGGTPAETTQLTLNSGVLNTNGQDETLGTARTDSAAVIVQGTSTIDFGAGDSALVFGNSSAASWTGTLELLNWSGSAGGAGTDQLFFGTDATGLTAAQLDAITFVNPAGSAAGSYDAKILATGEVVPVFAVARMEGDTNGDGVVDLIDLNNVLNNFGDAGGAGDDNGDGTIDLIDLNRVLNNFGDTAPASALSVVPEPTTLSVLALPALAVLGRRRNRR